MNGNLILRHIPNRFLFSPGPISYSFSTPYSGMLAVALDDFQISVIDTDTRRVVRKFSGHSSSITDMVNNRINADFIETHCSC